MSADLEGAKQRLRHVAVRGRMERRRLGLAEAKEKVRSASANFDRAGDELMRHLGAEELSAWVVQEPWRATLSAAASGFFVGKLKDSELLLVGSLLRLLG